VGLSKIASSKGTDASTGLVADGSCQTLARACCKYIEIKDFYLDRIIRYFTFSDF